MVRAHKFIMLMRSAPAQGKSIRNPFGRLKRWPLITERNLVDEQNKAANFLPASTSSDLCLHAAMDAEDDLKAIGSFPVNLVHDSIIIESDRSRAEEAADIITRHMLEAPIKYLKTNVPFKVDVSTGQYWGEGK